MTRLPPLDFLTPLTPFDSKTVKKSNVTLFDDSSNSLSLLQQCQEYQEDQGGLTRARESGGDNLDPVPDLIAELVELDAANTHVPQHDLGLEAIAGHLVDELAQVEARVDLAWLCQHAALDLGEVALLEAVLADELLVEYADRIGVRPSTVRGRWEAIRRKFAVAADALDRSPLR